MIDELSQRRITHVEASTLAKVLHPLFLFILQRLGLYACVRQREYHQDGYVSKLIHYSSRQHS